jgi:2-polyprenyl-3-methyl-5-hydroxy-6-metoxy-1,4-benzoquinol methylase
MTKYKKGGDIYSEKVYSNQGNLPLLNLIDQPRTVLDVGCGAGDNAALLKRRISDVKIYGITLSEREKEKASEHMERCWVADVETELPSPVREMTFDAMVFSHVLEHLRAPTETVRRLSSYLACGGAMYIAVPNAVVWSQRIHYARGCFDYKKYGILDETHLRFYTYYTVNRILEGAKYMNVKHKKVSGNLPMGIIRKFLPKKFTQKIDKKVAKKW